MPAATNKHQAKKRRLHDTVILRKVSEANASLYSFCYKNVIKWSWLSPIDWYLASSGNNDLNQEILIANFGTKYLHTTLYEREFFFSPNEIDFMD